MSDEEKAAVADTVNSKVAEAATDVANTNVTVVGFNSVCGRRLTIMDSDGTHRQLPSGSAAVEFSMLITGEYRPPVVLEDPLKPEPRQMDLGVMAEDSINRDPDQFVRDLKERAPPNSSLNEVTSIEVEAMEAPPEGKEVTFTRSPTEQPTFPPGTAQIQAEESGGGEKAILLACIVAITGIIMIVSAFLAFRMAGRRALARKEEEMELRKRRRQRERARQAQRRQQGESEFEEDAHGEWADDKNETTTYSDHPIVRYGMPMSSMEP